MFYHIGVVYLQCFLSSVKSVCGAHFAAARVFQSSAIELVECHTSLPTLTAGTLTHGALYQQQEKQDQKMVLHLKYDEININCVRVGSHVEK